MYHIYRKVSIFSAVTVACALLGGCALFPDGEDPQSAQRRFEMMQILSTGMQNAANGANPYYRSNSPTNEPRATTRNSGKTRVPCSARPNEPNGPPC